MRAEGQKKKDKRSSTLGDNVGAQVLKAGTLKQHCNSIFISICPRVSSCCCQMRKAGLPSRNPDITLGHIYIPPLTSVSHESLHCLARMQRQLVSCPDNIILKLQK